MTSQVVLPEACSFPLIGNITFCCSDFAASPILISVRFPVTIETRLTLLNSYSSIILSFGLQVAENRNQPN